MTVSTTARWILHADMDAFYASIEQRDHPEYRGKPVIVGATSARGVVSAASYEAREFGVRSAMPAFRARELCPQGIFVAGNMKRYAEVSEQVHRVFSEFTPVIEPIAFDEAFLDITGSVGLFGGPEALARELKRRVYEETELVISVGIAPNKLVAKIACAMSKPDGLKLVRQEEIRELLDPLPVRKLWGVGPVLGDKLKGMGIHTLGDLAAVDLKRLRRVAGERAAELQALSRGEDRREVVFERSAKSYGEENTFEHDISEPSMIERALISHAEAVARRVRRDGCRGRTVTIKLKLARSRGVRIARGQGEGVEPRYPILSRSKTLKEATADGRLISETAIALFRAERLREPVRLVGLSLSSLTKEESQQLDLFTEKKKVVADRLNPALDQIRERFGKEAIFRAGKAASKLTHSLTKKQGD